MNFLTLCSALTFEFALSYYFYCSLSRIKFLREEIRVIYPDRSLRIDAKVKLNEMCT